MPYIKQETRTLLNSGRVLPKDGGELQYVIAVLIKNIIGKDYNYAMLESMMGALTGAQLEFYREVVAKYEDKKKDLNGGVY